MFNFIFEGKIGEMLAPVAPSSPLFLAIQNHKSDEIQSLLLTLNYQDSVKLTEGGYSAIHVACRYNNRFALELLLSKGVSTELMDNNGNTPLHYAAKYGHIDICRVLVDRGCSVARKNNHGQNCYDVAENHVVRQYMLPLVFAAERNQTDQGGYDVPPHIPQQQPIPQYSVPQTVQPMGPPSTSYAPPPAPPVYQAPPSMMNPFQSRSNALPTTYNTGSSYGPPTNNNPPPGAEGIVPTYSHQSAAAAAQRPNNVRAIQPDGFHSSASDPELQRKYGHTKLDINIAPPPTDFSYSAGAPPSNNIPVAAGPQSYYAAPPHTAAGPPGGVYSRYVPYDPHTNSAGPLPPMAVPYGVNGSASQSTTPPSAVVNQFPTGAPAAPQLAGGNRLLGNKAVSGELKNNVSAVPVVVNNNSNNNTTSKPLTSNILVFNPATDCEIINASSSSSSVL